MKTATLFLVLLAACGGAGVDAVSWLEGDEVWDLYCPGLSTTATITVEAGGRAAIAYPPECTLTQKLP